MTQKLYLFFELNDVGLRKLSRVLPEQTSDSSAFLNAMCLLKNALNCEQYYSFFTYQSGISDIQINCNRIIESLLYCICGCFQLISRVTVRMSPTGMSKCSWNSAVAAQMYQGFECWPAERWLPMLALRMKSLLRSQDVPFLCLNEFFVPHNWHLQQKHIRLVTSSTLCARVRHILCRQPYGKKFLALAYGGRNYVEDKSSNFVIMT
jgi:hypothetical protein